MSESYENLAGASGRARFFRPRRYPASEFFSGAPPRLWFDDEAFDLENISLTGAGCTTKGAVSGALCEGSQSGVLRLTQRGRELLRVKARVARVSTRPGGVLVGFTLDDGGFDLSTLRKDNARAISATAAKAARALSIPPEYKSFCADVVSFVEDYLQHINQFYAPIEKEFSASETDELVLELAASAQESWQSLIAEGNRLVIPHHDDKKSRMELKAYTERVVTPELLDGEGWARSYYKPMGYPGDYQIMNYIYDGVPVGASIREKFLHQLSLVGSRPVWSRMKDISQRIADAAREAPSGGQIDFLSIGSGPARELSEIAAIAPQDISLRATLIDQEREALDAAVGDAHEIVSRGRLAINALNISFKEMLNPSSLADVFGDKDIIYSAGLVDYLNPLLAQRFLKRIYQYLKPGGKLIIGNLNDLESGMIWPCEYVTDWSLYFRSEAEMYAMAGGISGASITVHPDESNAVYFLVVEKPADA